MLRKILILGEVLTSLDNEQSIEFFNILRKLQACKDTFGDTEHDYGNCLLVKFVINFLEKINQDQ